MNKLELSKEVEEKLIITLTKTYETKKGNKWNVLEKEKRVINLEEYNKIVVFRLYGALYYRGTTCVGNIVNKIIDTIPYTDSRFVYNFDFKLN